MPLQNKENFAHFKTYKTDAPDTNCRRAFKKKILFWGVSVLFFVFGGSHLREVAKSSENKADLKMHISQNLLFANPVTIQEFSHVLYYSSCQYKAHVERYKNSMNMFKTFFKNFLLSKNKNLPVRIRNTADCIVVL